ncbi:hypothetical protein M441DRAFT_433671 [Trichoderma asperellum CBS 433.97]|uniref:IDI-2 n=1 Tax=Trichoderma asperellum (strain ATCC 204424 / CBS 433.97 / NBRC 101777) TaxID=1042311 RepID=A0A2T3Z2Z3_TRIA4|nr:hypothetical protein M441DRAFT_433671 [Trichoderma asperellum CBS 433.97]PTB39177.1 hypothetical protein M441DRAFT_433671 [Trichoderma asperellum CBS 433.97]
MKAAILSIFVAASAAFQGSNDATNEITADNICGELGAINLGPNELPGHVSLEDVRTCAQHPLGRNRTLDLSDEASVPPAYVNQSMAGNEITSHVRRLAQDSCYFGAPYGCSKGYCWKACGSTPGKWCWTAAGGGYGKWNQCASYEDCGTDDARFSCGAFCGKHCGCSC